MKKANKLLSTLLAILVMISSMSVLTFSASAKTTGLKSGDYNYTLFNNGTVEITRYNGSESVVEIPAEFDGHTVVSIDGAFYDCSSITKVTIPNGVTTLGSATFWCCKNLTQVTIPDSVTSIGYDCFQNCRKLNNLTLSNSLTSIGSDAFKACKHLESIYLPESVTSVGVGAFAGCDRLTDINVSENNTSYSSVDGALFNKDATELVSYPSAKDTHYTVPGTVTTIGKEAFYCCKSIEKLIIKKNVTLIDSKAFTKCINLKNVKMSNGVTEIGYEGFSRCKSLTDIKLSKNLKFINIGTFLYCTHLKKITIPNKVKRIDYDAFKNCKRLTKVNLPNSLKRISGAFENCTKLKNIKIPNSVKHLSGTFWNCSKLKNITIPKNVKTLDNVFASSPLVKVTVSNKNKYFTDVNGVVYSKDMKKLVYYPIGKKSKFYVVPQGVTSCSDGIFYGAKNLEYISLPKSLKSTTTSKYKTAYDKEYDSSFEGCDKLKTLIVHKKVKYLNSSTLSALKDKLTIYGEKGSYAQKFAKKHNIKFKVYKGA